MSLSAYRSSPAEQERTRDLLSLSPGSGRRALDIGARDGHFSRLLAERFQEVVALDLQRPEFEHPGVLTVQGDLTALDFPDGAFDFVLCAEVLEHIPPQLLHQACHELQRVCCGRLLIGVPNGQDLRVGRTTCARCGGFNPPWGHVNRFDAGSLAALFPQFRVASHHLVGHTRERSNALSAWLMDLAGNPYGTYAQQEPCVHCGGGIGAPAPRSLGQKVLTKLAFWARWPSEALHPPRGNWLHLLLERR
ncbi:methyltransferase domain-containing protein [Inhella sp.]|uniref:class I SAM-dependent methyltransferase n=1 Tax=Inhella sp. TaxID=1921806 RepID=UPI0035B22F41